MKSLNKKLPLINFFKNSLLYLNYQNYPYSTWSISTIGKDLHQYGHSPLKDDLLNVTTTGDSNVTIDCGNDLHRRFTRRGRVWDYSASGRSRATITISPAPIWPNFSCVGATVVVSLCRISPYRYIAPNSHVPKRKRCFVV